MSIWETGIPIGKRLINSLRKLLIAGTAILPSFILLLYFSVRMSFFKPSELARPPDLGNSLIHLTSIIDLTSAEAPFAKTTFFFLAIATLLGMIIKFSKLRLEKFDGFLISTFLLVAYYFLAPGSSGGIFTLFIRLQLTPFVVLPFWLASVHFPKWLLSGFAIVAISLVISLMVIRIPVHHLCSEAVEEIVSVQKYITPRSVVLPLVYTRGGKARDGRIITDRTLLFLHSGDYLGTIKPMIMLGNYEADTRYFPLLWRGKKDLFEYSPEKPNIESLPPRMDIKEYETGSGSKINYVVLIGLDTEFINHPYTVDILNQLNTGYTKIFTSQYGHAILYKRKGI